jgi:hypothetical protein
MSIIICDIDGTIADCSHRLKYIQQAPKDWDRFHSQCIDDAPIEHVIEIVRHLGSIYDIIYCTGRPDSSRGSTIDWLRWHKLPFGVLFMRKTGDCRPDTVVKLEMLKEVQAMGPVVIALEDRASVVKMWRGNGIHCFQVKEGDY